MGFKRLVKLGLVCVASLLADGADLQTLISALRAQQYQEALVLAKELQTKNASDPRVWTLEGMANEGLRNKAEALGNYRSAIKLAPDYLPALKAEAQLEYAGGDREAQRTLEHIVKLEPGDEVSHAMLAGLAYQQGRFDAAVSQYKQSLDAIAKKPDALTQYGECLLRQGEAEKAVEVLRQAEALDPNQWWSRYNLAAAEMSRKQASEAIKIIEPLLSDGTVRPEVLDLAAEAYEAAGDTPRAVELLRKAILMQPKNESYYLHFTDLCFDHASFQVGVDMIDAGLTQLPGSAKLYLARGILWGQLGDFRKAESDFDQADRLDPRGEISGAAASLAELQNSNLETALKLARARLKNNPRDPMLNYVKAETLKQMGVAPETAEFREALTSATTAVRLKPDFAAARNLLGSLYLQDNKLTLASEQFRRVLQDDPGDQTALYHLIQVSRRVGRSNDIPDLMKQLAQAKNTLRERDKAAGRYRLVEAR